MPGCVSPWVNNGEGRQHLAYAHPLPGCSWMRAVRYAVAVKRESSAGDGSAATVRSRAQAKTANRWRARIRDPTSAVGEGLPSHGLRCRSSKSVDRRPALTVGAEADTAAIWSIYRSACSCTLPDTVLWRAGSEADQDMEKSLSGCRARHLSG